jgi:hypothetical protein
MKVKVTDPQGYESFVKLVLGGMFIYVANPSDATKMPKPVSDKVCEAIKLLNPTYTIAVITEDAPKPY